MATAYTSLLGLALPVTGELSGTWGDVVNNSITQLVEDSVAGSATQIVTSGDWTLTTTGSGAANQARVAILIPTGTPGTTRNIIAPSSSKAYIVNNQTDSNIVVKGAATSGCTIVAGQTAVVAWNGSDFLLVASGDVDGPASATDNAIARFNGTTGKLIQNSDVTIADTTGTITTPGQFVSTITTGTAPLQVSSSTVVTNLNADLLDGKDWAAPNAIGTSTPAAGTFTQLDLVAQGDLRFQDASGGEYVGFQAPASVPTNVLWTLPSADGTSGQAITTNGSGTLSFSSAGISTGKSIAMAMIFGF
jgi:hypothetical protein